MEDTSTGGFEWQCDKGFRSACAGIGLTLYEEYEGKQYCVLHFPSKKKASSPQWYEALEKKRQKEDSDFSGVYFPERANFNEATFSGEAYFTEATFSEAAYFNRATFSEGALFHNLTTSSKTLITLAGTTIERPERIHFHTTHLRLCWFVDVDAQKFDFSDVEWFRLSSGEKNTLEAEAEILEDRGIEPPGNLRKLQKACRRLMNNAEENRDYQTANEFHYWSMEAQRKEGWRRLGLIATLYWALSGYGERPRRAFLVLLGIWVLFAILYMTLGHPDLRLSADLGLWQSAENFGRSLVYSLAAIARLNPDPRPDGPGLFQFLVVTEGILGPLQIALFALAVRRKVMR